MTNYDDYTKWKMVESRRDSGRHYLPDQEGVSVEEITTILQRLIKYGEDTGLENCKLIFSSTMEPYEDYLGPPQVTVVGYRPLSKEEKAELSRRTEVADFAVLKGITEYEASILLDLQKRGKV